MSEHKTQNDKILKHLLAGKRIDPIKALRLFGCFRLSGRIYDLKQDKWPVERDLVYKGGRRYAEYRLEAS
jgi:hypothetical protein